MTQIQRYRNLKKCGECAFFTEHKVCKFYHVDAPAGTTGVRTSLNKDSDKLLTKLGAFRPYMSSPERLRLGNKRRR